MPPTVSNTRDIDLAPGTNSNRRHEDALLAALIERNPNALARHHLRRLLPDLTDDEIDIAAQGLAGRGLVTVSDQPNQMVSGRVTRIYQLIDTAKYPVREWLAVGDIELHRAFQGDVAGAEDLNAFFEVLSEYNATVEERVRNIASDMTRRYWLNIAALFGLFVGVFALVTKGAELVTTGPSGSAMDLFWRNLAALGPLAAILFLFVLLLAVVLRRI
jgi:hypothetical protein